MRSSARLAVFAFAATLLGTATARAQAVSVLPRPEPHVTADATGELKIAPDLAIVRLGVSAEGADAKKATAKAADSMTKVTAAIRSKGIPAERIATERIDLQPMWEQDEDGKRPRIVGYRATNVVRVEVALGTPPVGAKAGEVVDAAIGAGANELQGIEFTLRDDEPARLRALAQASTRARARAEALAKALGVGLGRLIEATSGSAEVTPPPMPYMARAMKMEAAGTPIAPGELTVQATVGVTYAVEVPGK
jgi:uncharacterized protein YggE